MKKKSKSAKLLRSAAAAFVLTAAAVAVIVFMAFADSASYCHCSVADPNEVSPYLTHCIGPQFWDAVQQNKPFRLLLKEQGLNDIIARDSCVKGGWPFFYDLTEIYAPELKISASDVTVTDKIIYKNIPFYVSFTVIPVFDNGRMMLNIGKIMLGRINITSFAKAAAKKKLRQYFSSKTNLNPQQKILYDIISGNWFDPVAAIGQNRLRITAVRLADRQMTVDFVPIEGQSKGKADN